MEPYAERANGFFSQLCSLPMVEPFPARGGMTVNNSYRMALRDYVRKADPGRFHRLSQRAASCFRGDAPQLRIEALYHRLAAEPEQGADALRALCAQWRLAGQLEALQSLALALEELITTQTLTPVARVQCILRFCEIRGESLVSQRAEDLCREAQAAIADADHAQDRCDCHNLMGNALARQHRLREALLQYQQQLAICRAETQRNRENDAWWRELSLAHNCIGGILQLQKQLQQALSQYDAAKQIRKELVERQPEKGDRLYDLSISHNLIGANLQEQNKLPEALTQYNAGKQILEKLASHGLDNTTWAHALAVLYRHVGTILQDQGRPQEALREYEAGKRIIQELTSRDPNNAAWRHEFSILHYSVGSTLQTQAPDGALEEFKASKRILRELTDRDPDNAGWGRDLSVLLNSIGGILQAQGLLDEAFEEYEGSRQIMQNLTARYPDNPEWRRELSVSHSKLCAVLFAQHRPEAAMVEYDAAERIKNELVAREASGATFQPMPTSQVNLSSTKAPLIAGPAAIPVRDLADPLKQTGKRPSVASKKSIFVSYCSKDLSLRRELETHLTPLSVEGLIDVWTDTRIALGDEWSGEIDDNLKGANLILLLVSGDFLRSKYCAKEMEYALERHETGDARVIPIIARELLWDALPFAKLQILPRDHKPVDRGTRRLRNTVWKNIAKEIREYLVGEGSSAS
jgi:tetratricopeptide (TPR) repeat protein